MGDSPGHERAELMLAKARVLLADGRAAEAADVLTRAIDEMDGDRTRTRAADVLTEGESRVARMAVLGMKNREIAAELSVSVKAIEFHLGNAYRKLGVHGRSELARKFTWAVSALTLAAPAM
jgi:DNA-binding NarL/FixJ family response regulator